MNNDRTYWVKKCFCIGILIIWPVSGLFVVQSVPTFLSNSHIKLSAASSQGSSLSHLVHQNSPRLFSASTCTSLTATNAAFDFSAPSEWERFYQEHPDILEWHSSVPLERIASYIPLSWKDSDSDVLSLEKNASVMGPKILLVGCGNSRLPATLLAFSQSQQTRKHNRDNKLPLPQFILLDTSQTCLDQLQKIYGDTMEYVCGDATELQNRFDEESLDMIIDKGLSDALFCSEGWNGPIKTMYQNVSKVLKPNGKYLLISYKLPSSTHDFLDEVGREGGLYWTFDLPEDSNHRVGVSLATKRSE